MEEGHEGVVRILLQNGASAFKAPIGDENPFHDAVTSGQLGIVRVFLEESGTRIGEGDIYVALLNATREQHDEIAELLRCHLAGEATREANKRMYLHDAITRHRRQRDGDLSRRVPADRAGDAFASLAGSVNDTLDRVEALVVELQVATDGLAHDLKSPLTRLRSALERAAREVTEPAAQEAVDRALAEGERLLALVETALRITRAEAGIGTESFTPVDLAVELEDIAEIYGPVAEDAGRAIRVIGAASGVTLPIHRELIGQALGNAVDNALKYGAGTITLGLAVGETHATLSVADEGTGIRPEDRAVALRRFGRLDLARGGTGAGLGLSLIAAVARLHRGAVRLEDAHPGLIVAIDLPLMDRG